jgi:hypothetical protein
MNPQQTSLVPIDAAKEAGDLADLFNSLSQALDDFRLSLPPSTPQGQLGQLKDEAQALEDKAHFFTAQAIGATLQSIQPDLAKIKAATAEAAAQVAKLNTIEKVISIATAALALGASIASGNPGSIIATAEDLAQAVVA